MDSTFDATDVTRKWNHSGEALVQEGIGNPTGQTSKGYNYWGNNPENTTQPSTNVKPESINNVKEMFLGLKLGTFTFTVGESEYEVEPKKNYEGVVRFNIYKYNNETKLYNPVINPKTKRSLLTEEANNFLKNYLPKDYIDFIIDLSKNSKSKLDEAPSKTRLGKTGTIFNNLIDAYLFQIPVREMVYGEDSAPILLTLDEVNKKVNELYSSELISGIEKYLKPFVKDQLIKDIENIYKEKINNKLQTYLNDLEAALKNFETAPTTQSSASVVTDENTADTSTEVKRLGLKSTDKNGVFTYNDSNAKNLLYYTNISKNNPDVVFIHNTSVYEIKPAQIASGTTLGGSSNFMSEVPSMSINFPTNLFSSVVKGIPFNIGKEEYQTLKNIWEKRIKIIEQIQEKNGKIAFPEYGFGDPETMPQELFVYLSKRLFEAFQFINPGSTMYDQIKDMVSASQGISDAEILMQLELEEDPFKCS